MKTAKKIATFVSILFLMFASALLISYLNQESKAKLKSNSSEVVTEMKKMSRGDFILLKNNSILFITSPKDWSENGSFLAKGSKNIPSRYKIGSFPYEIEKIVFKSDTAEWNKTVRKYLGIN